MVHVHPSSVRPRARAACVVMLTCAAACASPVAARGPWPPPPSDAELVHDGTPEGVAAVRTRHAMVLQGEEVRLGGAVRPVRHGMLGTGVHPDVLAAGGEAARDEGGKQRAVMAVTGQVLMWGALVGATVLAPVPLAAGLFAVSAVDFVGARAVTNPVVLRWALPFTVGNAILGTLFVAGVGGLIIAPALVTVAAGVMLVELARTRTERATWRAVDAYNRALRLRVEALSPAPANQPESPTSNPTPAIQPGEAPP